MRLTLDDDSDLARAEVIVRRVSNINPVNDPTQIAFRIDWHPELRPLLDECILQKRFATRDAALKFEVGIVADLLNTNSGRSALAKVCADAAVAID